MAACSMDSLPHALPGARRFTAGKGGKHVEYDRPIACCKYVQVSAAPGSGHSWHRCCRPMKPTTRSTEAEKRGRPSVAVSICAPQCLRICCSRRCAGCLTPQLEWVVCCSDIFHARAVRDRARSVPERSLKALKAAARPRTCRCGGAWSPRGTWRCAAAPAPPGRPRTASPTACAAARACARLRGAAARGAPRDSVRRAGTSLRHAESTGGHAHTVSVLMSWPCTDIPRSTRNMMLAMATMLIESNAVAAGVSAAYWRCTHPNRLPTSN